MNVVPVNGGVPATQEMMTLRIGTTTPYDNYTNNHDLTSVSRLRRSFLI